MQEYFKNAMGNNGNNCSEDRKKVSQKWPKFHHFWNGGQNIHKTQNEIDMDHILVMINMCVELESVFLINIQNGQKTKITIKWPKLKSC